MEIVLKKKKQKIYVYINAGTERHVLRAAFRILLISGKINFFHPLSLRATSGCSNIGKAREIFKSARALHTEMCLEHSPLFSLFFLAALIKVFLPKSSATNQFKKIQSGIRVPMRSCLDLGYPILLALHDSSVIHATSSSACLDMVVIFLFIERFKLENTGGYIVCRVANNCVMFC